MVLRGIRFPPDTSTGLHHHHVCHCFRLPICPTAAGCRGKDGLPVEIMKFPGLKRFRSSRTAKVSMKIAAWGITRINRILPDTLKIHVFKRNRIAQIDEYLAHLESARLACAAQPDNPKCQETLSRALARLVAETFLAQREAMGFPLLPQADLAKAAE